MLKVELLPPMHVRPPALHVVGPWLEDVAEHMANELVIDRLRDSLFAHF